MEINNSFVINEEIVCNTTESAMADIKVSIVIPVYNAINTIEKCLNSILGQDFMEIEVICVDDGSEDGTRELLTQVAEKDERLVILLNDNNVGTFATRKRGVFAANGRYIMFADDDDWYLDNSIKSIYQRITDENVDILVYGADRKIVSDESTYIIEHEGTSRILPAEERLESENCLLTLNWPDRLWNKILKADVCKAAYASTEDVFLTHAEDTYVCWLLHYYARSFLAIKDIYYIHTVGDGLTTKRITTDNFDKWCSCRKKCSELVGHFLDQNTVSEEVLQRYQRARVAWFRYCVNTWLYYVKQDVRKECFEILIKHYGDCAVINEIADRTTTAENKNKKLIIDNAKNNKEIKKLSEDNRRLSQTKDILSEENRRLRQTKDKLERQKSQLLNSESYKLGTAITFIPRKLKDKYRQMKQDST